MEHLNSGKTLSRQNKKKIKSKHIDKTVKASLAFITVLSASIIFFIIFFITQRGVKPFVGYGTDNVNLWKFLTGGTYFRLPNIYGIGFVVVNTLIVVLFAVLISAPIGVLTALFISRIMPRPINQIFLIIVEMLASIPSIIFGVFGAGFITKMVNGLATTLGMQTAGGLSGLSVVLVLAIMILPTITLMSVTSINSVDKQVELGSMALGATKTYTYFKITLPAAKSGIFAGIILGVGRALGEATAVSMVAGNAGTGPNFNLLDTTRILTSLMLLELKETVDALINIDVEKAKTIIKDDDLVDNDYQKLIKEVSKWLREKKQGYENVISILLIGKYLERVADHSVNISEWVIFIATGAHKHSQLF